MSVSSLLSDFSLVRSVRARRVSVRQCMTSLDWRVCPTFCYLHRGDKTKWTEKKKFFSRIKGLANTYNWRCNAKHAIHITLHTTQFLARYDEIHKIPTHSHTLTATFLSNMNNSFLILLLHLVLRLSAPSSSLFQKEKLVDFLWHFMPIPYILNF